MEARPAGHLCARAHDLSPGVLRRHTMRIGIHLPRDARTASVEDFGMDWSSLHSVLFLLRSRANGCVMGTA